MTREHSIDEYVRLVVEQLDLSLLAKRRIRRELVDHVEDSVAELCDAGYPSDQATDKALAQLGEPLMIASALNAVPRRGRRAVRRTAAVSAAWTLAIAMGSATVWAADQPASHNPQRPVARCVAERDGLTSSTVGRLPHAASGGQCR